MFLIWLKHGFWKCSGCVIWPLRHVWTSSIMNSIWHHCQNMVEHHPIVHYQNMFDHGLAMVSHSLSNMVRHVLNMFLEVFWEYIMATWTWFRHHQTWTVYGTIVKTCSNMFWQGYWFLPNMVKQVLNIWWAFHYLIEHWRVKHYIDYAQSHQDGPLSMFSVEKFQKDITQCKIDPKWFLFLMHCSLFYTIIVQYYNLLLDKKTHK